MSRILFGVNARVMISALPPQSRICHIAAALIRRSAIFLTLMISLLVGVSNLPAVGAPTDTFFTYEIA